MLEAEQIMKRCQVGTRNYEEANNLHAACYGMIGKLLEQCKQLEGQAYDLLGQLKTANIKLAYAPPQRKPLTDEQAYDLFGVHYNMSVIRNVEAAHGIKE